MKNHALWIISYSFCQVCQQRNENIKMATKDRTLVAIILFPKCLYQQEAVFFSEVVIYKKSPRSEDRGLAYSIDSDLCGDSILIILEHKHEKFNACNNDRDIQKNQ